MFSTSHKYSMKILINGREIYEYRDNANDVWVEGREGSNYEIELQNHTGQRVMAVVSVDGLSVLNGERASVRSSNGYVLSPYQTMRIPGWTLSNREVAAFKFGKTYNSYATQTGKSQELGVISSAWFEEAAQVVNLSNLVGYDTLLNGAQRGILCSASYASAVVEPASLGTEFGARQDFQTTAVSFRKRDPNHYDALISIYYDDQRGLERRGISIREQKVNRKPNPFVDEGCTPPPGWRG
jgi:hypothetical protein